MCTAEIWERLVAACGGAEGVGKVVGRSRRRIYQLMRAREPVPLGWCPALSRATQIPLHDLRPDAFDRAA